MKATKAIVLSLLGFPFFFSSCSDDDSNDSLSSTPAVVTNLSAETADESVILSWHLTNEKYYAKSVVAYGNQSVDVARGINSVTISGLKNDSTYIFSVYSVDVYGQTSDTIKIEATPLLKLAKLTGHGIVYGTYEGSKGVSYTFSESNNTTVVDSMINVGFDFQSGLYYRKNPVGYDISLTMKALYNDDNSDSRAKYIAYNAAFTFTYDSVNYLGYSIFEKYEGDNNVLEGNYRSFNAARDLSASADSLKIQVFVSEVRDLKINEDFTWTMKTYSAKYTKDMYGGTVIYSYNVEKTTTGTWSVSDVRNKKYKRVEYGDKSFLISQWDTFYKKVD
jgi:hypothetical protein